MVAMAAKVRLDVATYRPAADGFAAMLDHRGVLSLSIRAVGRRC
jgi:hypothetical protein